jgi:hypothetical protein
MQRPSLSFLSALSCLVSRATVSPPESSWNSAWFPRHQAGTALGVFGAGNVGAAGTKLLIVLVPSIPDDRAGSGVISAD